MIIDDADIIALKLTLQLAISATTGLLIIGTPLAWWLAQGQSRLRAVVSATVSLPLVLPPTVLGFYLLVLFSPSGFLGMATQWAGIGTLAFTFSGLVIASMIYSLPFIVQPLKSSFETIGPALLEAAATLRAGPIDRFFSVAVPIAAPGFVTAIILSFSHTIGEFGIVLMIGGNIPGSTRVLSVAIFDHVEALEYGRAHVLAGGMLVFSFMILLAMQWITRSSHRGSQHNNL